ncbi:site-specific integrase [Bacteroides heparinolyticus]|uniref:site-specific integrase n=1 Tax=Prevotella heparinolytica TaxID=28113 RepID=UPI0035A00A40
MITVKTYIRKHTPQMTSGIIWVSFYINREKINFSTRVSVEEKNWNAKKQTVNSGDKLAADKNLIIDNILARINNVLVKYRLKDKRLTKDAFLRAYHRPSDYNTFFEYVEVQERKFAARIEMSTLLTQRSVIKKLKEYAPTLYFDDITVSFLDDYYLYMRKEYGNNNNTAYKNMSVLKKYVRLAYKDGYMTENPFEEWKIKKGTASCTYLTEEELEKLIALYKSGELEHKLHKTLEFFLFLCFSSVHVGDAKKLKLEQFSETTFTYFRIKLRNIKPEPIVVPISSPLRAILANIVGTRKKGPVFEMIPADQTMNRYLKQIATIAELDKTLTHKVGRHTFATIYLRKTKDIASLREILGHSDVSETLIYAHVLDESKQEGVQCFSQFAL